MGVLVRAVGQGFDVDLGSAAVEQDDLGDDSAPGSGGVCGLFADSEYLGDFAGIYTL